MNKETNKNEYVTRKDLEEQTQIILDAMDSILTKRLGEVNNRLDDLKTDVNRVQALIDGYVKAQEDFKQDFVIMKEEFKQMKQIIKEKLGIEIRAI
ncbi:MAG: hypothetical protein P4L62_01990 [Candidatus Pacebacteria bacterium]|nr:hypothetical protein [Candidatus Paceibacterota bacterium]